MLHTGSPSGCTCPVQSVSPSFQQLWKLWIAFSVIFSTSTLKSPSSFCLKKTCTSSAGRAFPTETTEMGDELTALLLPHVQFQCLHIFSQFFGYRMFLSTSEQSYLTVFVECLTTVIFALPASAEHHVYGHSHLFLSQKLLNSHSQHTCCHSAAWHSLPLTLLPLSYSKIFEDFSFIYLHAHWWPPPTEIRTSLFTLILHHLDQRFHTVINKYF